MSQIWLVYAHYAVGLLSKSVDFGRINASVVRFILLKSCSESYLTNKKDRSFDMNPLSWTRYKSRKT